MGEDEIIAVLDWKLAKGRPENREMVGYARAHGFLFEAEAEAHSLVVTPNRLYLVPTTAHTLMGRLGSNIVSPPGGGVLR